MLFGLGVGVVTFGITRYSTFREFPPPPLLNASEGDGRYITELIRLIVSVLSGFAVLALSGYVFGKARKKT